MNERKQRIEALFEAALELTSTEQREDYLRRVAGDDSQLRSEVVELLHAHEKAGKFLAAPTEVPPRTAAGNDAMLVPNLEQIGESIGRYKLLEKIGEGGMGVVYMAEQEEPVRRRVGLKVIKLGMDTRQVMAGFNAERQALAMMDHPHIARVLDAGATESGRPYFVMELVRGVRITDYCNQNSLSPRQRLDLFIPVCQAIQHAHQKGIIHRDIKPSNILVTLHDGVPVPKVIDFGIAKAAAGRLTDQTLFTAFEQFLGTPAYMSPEQAEMSGLDIDTRSDIYSLGVLLYELLTGKTPFDAKDLLEAGLDAMRRTIREKEPVRPSTRLNAMLKDELTKTARQRAVEAPRLVNLIRGDLDWVVMKCLEKDRARRYDTANGLVMDIRRHLTQEPVIARPPSRLYEFERTVRRHRLGFAAVGAVILAPLLGAVASAWQARRAVEARDQAKASARMAERALYAANMNLVQQAWEQSNLSRVRQLLEETEAWPERGFEWYYWQRQTHLPLQTLRGHLGPILAVAFSPSGAALVTASEDHTAKLWDAASGKELRTFHGHGAPIGALAFSSDGQRLVTGSWDQSAKLWAVSSGKELLTLQGHQAAIDSVAISADGRRIVTVAADGEANVWDAADGNVLLNLHGLFSDQKSCAAISSDAQRIITGSAQGEVKVWDVARAKPILTLQAHSVGITSLAFFPDGERFVTCSWDQTAKVWDAASGRNLSTLEGITKAIGAVAFSPDGKFVTGSFDFTTAAVWDTASGRQQFWLKTHSGPINAVAFAPDPPRILTGGQDGTARLWPVASDKEPLILRGHSNWVWSATFSPDGRKVVTASEDGTAKIWDARQGHLLLTLSGQDSAIGYAVYSPDGGRILTTGEHAAKIWDAQTGEVLLSLKGHSGNLNSVAFFPDGERGATASSDGAVKVWDATNGKELATLGLKQGSVWGLAISPDGRRLAAGAYSGVVQVWDTATWKEMWRLRGHRGFVSSLAFSPDGRWLVTGSQDGSVRVWDLANGTELPKLGEHLGWVGSVTFSPDGRRIAASCGEATARLWDAVSGKELLSLKGSGSWTWSIAFPRDGLRLLTSGEDRTAMIWTAASAAQVASWQQEEREATEYLAAQQRQRAAAAERNRSLRMKDPGAIKQWLMLPQIGYPGEDGLRALLEEQVAPESKLRPRAGERAKVGQSDFVWRTIRLEDNVIDSEGILGAAKEFSITYAVCYIWSETSRVGLNLEVACNDQSKVYLNGQQVYHYRVRTSYGQAAEPGQATLSDPDVVGGVALRAGLNVVVFKVVNEVGQWQASLRLCDAAGNPLKGIRVGLDPDGKDSP
jgi:WD40 repeat protein/serine/threonine protein kinase